MIIDRYILKAHIGPFFMSLFVLVGIFILQFMMKFIDHLVGKGLGVMVVIEVIITNLAWMLVLAIPMSVLISTLMAYGTMSANNEITVMKSSGISVYRMMTAPLIFSVFLAWGLMEFNNHILPDANHRAKTLGIDIRRARPTLSLQPGIFSQEIRGYTIIARKNYEETNELEGLTIYDHSDPNTNVIIAAERGFIAYGPDFSTLILDLFDGEMHETSTRIDNNEYRRIKFNRHRVVIPYEGYDFERTADNIFQRGDRELSAQDMLTRVDSLKSQNSRILGSIDERIKTYHQAFLEGEIERLPPILPTFEEDPYLNQLQIALARARMLASSFDSDLKRTLSNERRIDQYMVEVHKKYAIPIACIIFILIGAPLGIMTRKGGFGVAAGISLGFFLMYWSFLIGGEKLADRGFITPFIGMWGANILLLPAGIYLTIRTQKERLLINWNKLSRIVPKRWRIDTPDNQESGDVQ
jgi:lipopolysaccharide export system permease protein